MENKIARTISRSYVFSGDKDIAYFTTTYQNFEQGLFGQEGSGCIQIAKAICPSKHPLNVNTPIGQLEKQ